MLRELKFVRGAVAKKEFITSMTHFAIEDGTIRSFNGTLALCAPIALDINCKPKAVPMVEAIIQCGDEVPTLSMTDKGKLRIVAGNFKALINCIEEETPHVQPDGEEVQLGGHGEALIAALRTVAPFIGTDASRPWSNGVLLRGESAYATNNVIGVQYWTGVRWPFSVNVPKVAIEEILRIDEAPTHAQVTERSITFHYEDRRWIRTALLATDWPDIDKVLISNGELTPIDKGIFVGIDKVRKFCDKSGRVYFKDGVLSTTEDPEEGASFKVPGIDWQGIYNVDMLRLLSGVAEVGDFKSYPQPCTFQGGMLRGAIVGMRL